MSIISTMPRNWYARASTVSRHIVRDQAVDKELLDMMKAKGTWQVSSTLSREMVYSMAVMPWLQRSLLHPRRHARHR